MVVNSLKYAEELRRNISKQAAASEDVQNEKNEENEKNENSEKAEQQEPKGQKKDHQNAKEHNPKDSDRMLPVNKAAAQEPDA